jgi:hypothetical protein
MTRATLSMMPIQKKLQLHSGGSHIIAQFGNTTVELVFLKVDDKLMREWVRPGARGLVYLFAVLMCCIRSHASFFQTRRPLTVSAPEPTAGSEK